MKTKSVIERLGVCSWSLQPASPRDLVSKVSAAGLHRLQLDLDPFRETPKVWAESDRVFQQNGMAIVSGMFRCLGEDYTTLESIRATGGIAPDGTWEQNWQNIQTTAGLASRLGLRLVTFHAGFLPHEESDPNFAKLAGRLARVADLFDALNIVVGLETGQETAAVLLHLLNKLDRANIGVNFDPANMILYDKGDPIEALRVLGPWIRQVHIKDARRTKKPGTWGEEVAVGSGEVDWRSFFNTLEQLNYTGEFVIEREAGQQRLEDIRTAGELVKQF